MSETAQNEPIVRAAAAAATAAAKFVRQVLRPRPRPISYSYAFFDRRGGARGAGCLALGGDLFRLLLCAMLR